MSEKAFRLCNRNLKEGCYESDTRAVGVSRRSLAYQVVVVVFIMCMMAGCASVRLVACESNPHEHEVFVEKCGWTSDMEGGKTEIRVAQRETIGAVNVHFNYLYALGTVLSLGHWIPFQITYEVNQHEQTH